MRCRSLDDGRKDTHSFCTKVLQSNRYSIRMLTRACSCLLVEKRIWGSAFNIYSVCLPIPPDQVHVCSSFNSPAMGLDLVLLILSTIGLLMSRRPSLWELLFRDGIVYFVIAFFANLTAAVFLFLNLNHFMDVMLFIPATCITASAATRSFIRLQTHLIPNTHVQSVLLIPPDRLTLTLPGRKHAINRRPGAHYAGTNREATVVVWTCTRASVDAGTFQLPDGNSNQ